MYARGMSTREITGHLHDLYGVDVSPDLISTVTDAVLDEVATWQQRSLDPVYPLIFFEPDPGQDPGRRDGSQQNHPYRVGRPRRWRQGGTRPGSSRMKAPSSGCR